MAATLSDGQYQVFYGIHTGAGTDKGTPISSDTEKCQGSNLHIHFAINTVNFRTLNKRQETMAATREHEKQLQRIVKMKLTGQ